MSGLVVALEVIKYVLPLLLTIVLSLVASHFKGLQRRVDAAEETAKAMLDRMHALEMRQTQDRGDLQGAIKAAVGEVFERIAVKYVSTAAYLTGQVQLDQRLDRIDTTLDQMNKRLEARG